MNCRYIHPKSIVVLAFLYSSNVTNKKIEGRLNTSFLIPSTFKQEYTECSIATNYILLAKQREKSVKAFDLSLSFQGDRSMKYDICQHVSLF